MGGKLVHRTDLWTRIMRWIRHGRMHAVCRALGNRLRTTDSGTYFRVSKAFTKEDDEIPEQHEGRHRSSSGLPPGATNYMTAEGARRLRKELAGARGRRAAQLQQVLDSATIVPEHESTPKEALF